MKVTRKEGSGKSILAQLMRDASTQVAQVGIFPGGKAYPDTGELIATVAGKHEFGSPEDRIPPRPFMRPTIAKNKEEWRQITLDGCMMVAKGKLSIAQILDGVGERAAGDVLKKISSIWTPPLAPYTLQKRAERAGLPVESVSKKPLIDTGAMYGQITSAVVKK